MEKYYQIAGIGIRVEAKDEEFVHEEGILSAYSSQDSEFEHSLKFELVEKLDQIHDELLYKDAEKQVYRKGEGDIRFIGAVEKTLKGAYMSIDFHGHTSQIQLKRDEVKRGVSPRMILNAMEAERLIVERDGFILHASYINAGGKAILFTAPSGTGKSTQASLWEKHRGAEILNGDRAAVRVKEDGIFVYGIPFAGSSKVCKNVTLPLGAIVYLGQAPSTVITRLKGRNAFRCVWEGCSVNSWDRTNVEMCMKTVTTVIENIPVYHLACTPDENAVRILEEECKKWSGWDA